MIKTNKIERPLFFYTPFIEAYGDKRRMILSGFYPGMIKQGRKIEIIKVSAFVIVASLVLYDLFKIVL